MQKIFQSAINDPPAHQSQSLKEGFIIDHLPSCHLIKSPWPVWLPTPSPWWPPKHILSKFTVAVFASSQHSSCCSNFRSHVLFASFVLRIHHYNPSLQHTCILDLSYFWADNMVFYLKWTKTNQFSQLSPVSHSIIAESFQDLCKLLQISQHNIDRFSPDKWLLDSGWFHQHFCHVLSFPGISPVNYSRCLLRIDDATSHNGIPEQ